MAQATAISQFVCPSCGAMLATSGRGMTRCGICAWKGEAFHFWRLPTATSEALVALPDEATCIHHPRKKATATCAGTGDYICSLCAVELNGQTYSAQYLDGGGKEKLGGAFERYLPRPDSQIALYLLLMFIPYANFLMFLWLPHGFFLYLKALKMRRENPLFRKLMSPARVVIYPILLALESLIWIGLIGMIIYLITSDR